MEKVKEYTLGQLIENTRLGGNYNTTVIPNQNPLIKMGNLDRGKIKLTKIEYIKSQEINENDLLKYGDVLFNTRNTPELVGKIAIWRNELKKAYYNSNLMLLNFNKNYVEDNFYMNYLFNTKNFIKKTNSIAIGTTSVAAIYNRDLMKLTVKIVPKKEQKAIADTLINVDNLIDSLQRTIKKKEKIKISTIQKYFTGRERLNKYSSKWIKGTIEDISTEIMKGNGLSKESLEVNGSNKCILYGELFTVYNELIESVVSRTNINSNIYSKKGDILIPGSTTTVGKDLAKACVINEDDVLLGGDINIIRVKNNISPVFIAYLFSNILYKEVEKVAQGTTIIHLHGKNIAKIPIFIPSEYKEQEELAKILIKMDEELNLLNKKLDKYKQIKEGMMEDLLTGKVRLNYE